MIVVDGFLEGRVSQSVPVRKIFCYDGSAGFVFLRVVVGVWVGWGSGGGGRSGGAVKGDGGGDVDLGGAEVGVLEEEGCSGC